MLEHNRLLSGMTPLRVGLIKATNPLDVQYHKPLAFGYLTAYALRHCNFPIQISQLDDEKNLDKINVLGISCTSQDYAVAIEFARLAKSCNPGIISVLGGHHITHLPNTLNDAIDIGVIGEGEITFSELLTTLHKDNLIIKTSSLSSIRGIVFRDNGRNIITEPRELILPLDTLPHPLRTQDEVPYLFTSRGCPYKCAFCSSTAFWDKTRFFSAEYVVEEIEDILRQFPATQHITIWDDLFAANKSRFNTIIELLEQRGLSERLRFSFSCRSNIINDELCAQLKRLQVPSAGFGAESGSDRILKLMNKGSTVALNQQAIDCLHRHEIPVGCSFVVGWPTETENEVRQTFDFILENLYAQKMSGGFSVNILMPIPGTPVWDDAVAKGKIDPQTIDWKRLAVFAAFRDSTAASLDDWIDNRRKNNSLYLAEETLPQERLYELMREYQILFDRYQYHSVAASKEQASGKSASGPSITLGNGTDENYYTHARADIVDEVPVEALCILDVGCGAGRLGEALKKQHPGRLVYGIELCEEACRDAGQRLDKVFCGDVETVVLPFKEAQFDCIIFADILEHLKDPWDVVGRLKKLLKPAGSLIISLPNIRNIEVMYRLIHDGCWEYEDEGILDRTHLRFFTRRQFLGFLDDEGIVCSRITYTGGKCHEAIFFGTTVRYKSLTVTGVTSDDVPELFATQVIYACRYCTPHAKSAPEQQTQFPLPQLADKNGVFFGRGFFEEEGGSCWMGPAATLHVPSAILDTNKTITFELNPVRFDLLKHGVFQADITYNDVPFTVISIPEQQGRSIVQLPLFASSNDATIKISCSDSFRPSDDGKSSDSRQLSLLFSNLVIN